MDISSPSKKLHFTTNLWQHLGYRGQFPLLINSYRKYDWIFSFPNGDRGEKEGVFLSILFQQWIHPWKGSWNFLTADLSQFWPFAFNDMHPRPSPWNSVYRPHCWPPLTRPSLLSFNLSANLEHWEWCEALFLWEVRNSNPLLHRFLQVRNPCGKYFSQAVLHHLSYSSACASVQLPDSVTLSLVKWKERDYSL